MCKPHVVTENIGVCVCARFCWGCGKHRDLRTNLADFAQHKLSGEPFPMVQSMVPDSVLHRRSARKHSFGWCAPFFLRHPGCARTGCPILFAMFFTAPVGESDRAMACARTCVV